MKKTTTEMKNKLSEISKILIAEQSNNSSHLIQNRIHMIEKEITNLESEHKISRNKIFELYNKTIPSLQEKIKKNENNIQKINKVLEIFDEIDD